MSRKVILAACVVLVNTAWLRAQVKSVVSPDNKPVLSARCAAYKPFSIEISSLIPFYNQLSADEQEEQTRDWAFYGLLNSLELKPSDIGVNFPMRYASLRDKYRFEVAPGRAVCPQLNDCIMLVSVNQASDTLIQGFIFDKARISFGAFPARVHVFSYQYEKGSGSITTAYVRTISGKALLSAEYGYTEKAVTGPEELRQFLNTTGDITTLLFKEKTIVLGGRRNRLGQASALNYTDVAELYQAYMKNIPENAEKERRESYERFLQQQYQSAVTKDKALRKAIKEKRITYGQIMKEIRSRIPYSSLEEQDANVGFSLDSFYDNTGLAQSMKELAAKTGSYEVLKNSAEISAFVDTYAAELTAAADKLRSSDDITPLLRVRRKISGAKSAFSRQLEAMIQDIELNNTYQIARYDGKMKGTGAAMVLFYTDLTAKLWALDYNGTAPKGKIMGFQTLSDIKIPRLYWDDFIRLSKTRLWFGLRQESFDVRGNEIIFEPVATRVYAASSDPLYPGKESEPNYQSGEFLGWWDRHYASVADYEPYFHKLNQLQKWSCIMMILKEKHSKAFDFLQREQLTRSLDFEAWYNNEGAVKNRVPLPFIDKNRFNKTNECFKILQSKGYPLMGQTFFISGGVSLASRKDIAAKLRGRGAAGSGPATKTLAGRPATGKSAGRPARKTLTGKPGAKGSSASGGGAAKPVVKKNNYGELTAKTEGQTVKLAWQKGEGAVLEECVNTLVDMDNRTRQQGKNEGVFSGLADAESVVRLEHSKLYLIKSKTLKDKWIYVAVNPEGKKAEFKAKAAGTEPDSDMFYAKAVSAEQASKLILEKKGTPIWP